MRATVQYAFAAILIAVFLSAWHSKAEDSTLTNVELKLGEMLLVESSQGQALIFFTEFGDQTEESIYRWRYRAKGEKKETFGEGKVFEKYERAEKSPDKYILRDVGSQVTVHAGAIQLEWSYGMEGSSGWLYYNSKELKVKKLSGANFNSFKFE